jgi:hypothetical protein
MISMSYAQTALDAAQTLAGVYEGHGKMYAFNLVTGKTVLQREWDETLIANDPRIENGRAIVTVESTMDFGASEEEMHKSAFVEGFIVEDDGSPGFHFFETPDTTVVFVEVQPGEFHWGNKIPIGGLDAQGLYWLYGVLIEGGADPKSTFQIHDVHSRSVKIVSRDELGREQHDVTETVFLEWSDTFGQRHSSQYVVRKVKHTKVSNCVDIFSYESSQ